MKRMLSLIGFSILALGINAQDKPSHEFAYTPLDGFHISNIYTVDANLAFFGKWNDYDYEVTLFDDDLNVLRVVTFLDAESPDYFDIRVEGISYDNKQVVILDNGLDSYGFFTDRTYFTQTLFSDNDKLELLRVVYDVKTIKETDNYYRHEIFVTRFEIVSEDGAVIGGFLPPDELKNKALKYPSSEMTVFTLGNNNYLAWEGDDYWESGSSVEGRKVFIYKINKSPSNMVTLQRVTTGYASPNPVKRNQTLTIKLENEIQSADSYVQITDMSGRVILRQTIDMNTREIRVPANRLSQGQCIYTVVSGGKAIDQGKVICR